MEIKYNVIRDVKVINGEFVRTSREAKIFRVNHKEYLESIGASKDSIDNAITFFEKSSIAKFLMLRGFDFDADKSRKSRIGTLFFKKGIAEYKIYASGLIRVRALSNPCRLKSDLPVVNSDPYTVLRLNYVSAAYELAHKKIKY